MDKFKEKMTCKCGPGGIKCHCCNPFHTGTKMKDKQKLERLARRILKREDAKELLTTED